MQGQGVGQACSRWHPQGSCDPDDMDSCTVVLLPGERAESLAPKARRGYIGQLKRQGMGESWWQGSGVRCLKGRAECRWAREPCKGGTCYAWGGA